MKSLFTRFAFCASLFLTATFTLTAGWASEHEHQKPLVKIKVLLTEMSFQVEGLPEGAPLVLKAGERYKLIFENVGVVMHEVLLGRGLISNHGDHNYQEHMLADTPLILTGSSVLEGKKRIFAVDVNGFEEFELDPGLRLSLLVTIPETARGEWELGCFAAGHHEAGMFLPVLVQ